ncbi:MAG: TolC family protein [Longimicrobiaceae bacterium]
MRTPLVRGLLLCVLAAPAAAQGGTDTIPTSAAAASASAPGPTGLDTLTARAVAVHPAVRAAAARVEAARARIAPAGSWEDPMLMAGLQNLPVSDPGFAGEMTMKMVGVGQRVPFPGKTRLRRSAAERELAAAEAALDAARLEAVQRVRDAYYELAYLDRALEVTARSQQALVALAATTQGRYAAGLAGQEDVLRARVEAARMAEEAAALTEQRRTAQARLNEALDRPSETPVPPAAVPERIARAAVAASPAEVRFVSPALGARAADSPLPQLRSLEETAVARSPVLRERQARIDAQAARVELARRDRLPDFDVSLQYGQRDGMPDMLSATVSVPLPVQRGRRQDAFLAEARADSAALEAERHAERNRLRLEVARLHSEAERARAQLALYVGSILPQGRAAVESATANYRAGRAGFEGVLESQGTLFSYEIAHARLLSDFARAVAELERVVGTEVLR